MDVRMPDGTIIRNVPEGTPKEEIAAKYTRMRARNAMQEAQGQPPEYSPTEGNSFLQNLGIGFGKSFVDTGRGLKQLAADAGAAIAPGMFADDAQRIRAENTEAARLDAPIMRTGGGIVGNIAGTASQFAIPGSVAARAVTIPGRLAAGAGIGAAIANTQPVTGEQSRAVNTTIGAAGGALGESLALGIGRLSMRNPNVSDEVAALARRAQELDIPLRAEQVTGSRPLAGISAALDAVPFSGRDAARDAQRAGFNRALSRTVGENTDNVATAVKRAQANLGGAYDNVLRNNAVRVDDVVTQEVDDVLRAAQLELTDPQFAVIQRQINNLRAKVSPEGTIDGQAAYNIKKMLDRIGRGNDSSLAYHATELKNTLIAALDRSLPDDVARQFAKTRKQYANLIALRKLVKAGAEGNVSPAALGNVRGLRGDLKEVADIGAQFMKEPFGNSGTQNRLVGAGIIGGLGTGAMFEPSIALTAAGTGLTIGRGTNALLQSPAFVNYQLGGSNALRALLPYARPVLPALGAAGAVAGQ